MTLGTVVVMTENDKTTIMDIIFLEKIGQSSSLKILENGSKH